MTIFDRANAFIGHEEEADEGLEVTMRRNAFFAGFKEAMGLVKKMREAQKEWEADLANDYDEHWGKSWAKDKLESEVDELIKEVGD